MDKDELFQIAADITKSAMSCESKSTSDIFNRAEDVVSFFATVYDGLKKTLENDI